MSERKSKLNTKYVCGYSSVFSLPQIQKINKMKKKIHRKYHNNIYNNNVVSENRLINKMWIQFEFIFCVKWIKCINKQHSVITQPTANSQATVTAI